MYQQKICYIDLYKDGVKCGNMGHIRLEWEPGRYRFDAKLCHMDRQTLVTAVMEMAGREGGTKIQDIPIIHGKGSYQSEWLAFEGNEERILFEASGGVYGVCGLPQMENAALRADGGERPGAAGEPQTPEQPALQSGAVPNGETEAAAKEVPAGGGVEKEAAANEMSAGRGTEKEAAASEAPVGRGAETEAAASEAPAGRGAETEAGASEAPVGRGAEKEAGASEVPVGRGTEKETEANEVSVGRGAETEAEVNEMSAGGGTEKEAGASEAPAGGGVGKEKIVQMSLPAGERRTAQAPAQRKAAPSALQSAPPSAPQSAPQRAVYAGQERRSANIYPLVPQERRRREQSAAALMDDKWKQLCSMYPMVHPVGSDIDFLKITPADFVILRQEYQGLVRNSFLLHGYYNYNHILLGKYPDTYYIGVPGIMHEQERAAAAMFGFVGFENAKAPEGQKGSGGQFGYYMMEVGI